MSKRDLNKHCGACRETGHSARTCRTATEPSATRAKEVLDQLFGKDRNKEEAQERNYTAAVTPRLLYAPRGPRYMADGSYRQPYRFSPALNMDSTGAVWHTVTAKLREVA